jgi:hypothetical protein
MAFAAVSLCTVGFLDPQLLRARVFRTPRRAQVWAKEKAHSKHLENREPPRLKLCGKNVEKQEKARVSSLIFTENWTLQDFLFFVEK